MFTCIVLMVTLAVCCMTNANTDKEATLHVNPEDRLLNLEVYTVVYLIIMIIGYIHV